MDGNFERTKSQRKFFKVPKPKFIIFTRTNKIFNPIFNVQISLLM